MNGDTRSPTQFLERSYIAILLVYVFGISVFGQNLARLSLNIGGIPLFVGEATIALLLTLQAVLLLRTRRLPFRIGMPEAALLIFLFLGAIYTVLGLLRGFGLAALRDSALVYYLLFYFFVLLYPGSREGKTTILRAVALGGVVSAFVYGIRFLVSPNLTWQHGAGAAHALIAWVGAVFLSLSYSPGEKPAVLAARTAAVAMCLFLLYLSAYRTMVGSVLASLAVLWLGKVLRGVRKEPGSLRGLRALTAGTGLMAILVIAHANLLTPSVEPLPVNGPLRLGDAFEVLSTRWVRGFYVSDEGEIEGSLFFRAEAWRNALGRIRSSPWTGIGFGPAPALYPDSYCDRPYSATSNCGNAHNTFLTIAMRMGIPAFFFFMAINVIVAWPLIVGFSRHGGVRMEIVVAEVLLVALLSFSIYAFMSLFLESPQLSSVYWVILGLARSRTLGSGAEGAQTAPAAS